MPAGSAPSTRSRSSRLDNTRVLPVPAEALTQTELRGSAARCWSGVGRGRVAPGITVSWAIRRASPDDRSPRAGRCSAAGRRRDKACSPDRNAGSARQTTLRRLHQIRRARFQTPPSSPPASCQNSSPARRRPASARIDTVKARRFEDGTFQRQLRRPAQCHLGFAGRLAGLVVDDHHTAVRAKLQPVGARGSDKTGLRGPR